MVCMKFWLQFALSLSVIANAWAQPTSHKALDPVPPSALDATLFYQIVLAELTAQQGSVGSGFSIMLDAARKTTDAALFQRAVDMALQARAGDAALQAAQTWKRQIPSSAEASRYVLQILLALNRIEEAGKALTLSVRELPLTEQPSAIATVPRLFGAVQDKARAADVVENALSPVLAQASTAAAAWTTVGRMRRDAGQMEAAVAAAVQAHRADPQATGPLILALNLMDSANSPLKPMLDAAMGRDATAPLRLGYARALLRLQLRKEALAQLLQLNTQHPDFAEGWLIHGLLLQENAQWQEAENRLVQYVRLTPPNPALPEQREGLAQALMSLAQMAQQQGQMSRASKWLSQVPTGTDPIELARRQADLLTQQGRKQEAQQLLAQVKPANAEQARRKVLLQSLWLRENGQTQAAYDLLQSSAPPNPDDPQLLTEWSLVCEKLKRFDEMEALLRQLMAIAPQEAHAFNALGYSLADRNLRLQEAQQLIEKAIQLSPNDAYIQDSLGWVKFRQGLYPQALAILEAAYKAKPDAEIAAHLGEVLWVTGRQREAGIIWREGLLLKADNETLVETLKRFRFTP